MAEKKWTMMVVPETHWDREWYLTFQQFRHKLVALGDNLLHIMETDPRYEYYVFDGQTVVLEDYLQIRPQNRGRLADLVKAERLFVGPWYVLPDEFLVSGEALVHNILLGHKIAAEFGRVMKAGYVPDPFGHVSQLPQILAGFGLDSALFMRGVGNELDDLSNEFWWEAPDGSRVLGIHLINSYCNGANLGQERWAGPVSAHQPVDMDMALQRFEEERSSLSQKAATSYLLLNNGCDHLEPQPELPDIIEYANARIESMEIVHSHYEAYVEAVLSEVGELGTVRGELHSGKYWPLLSGVYSARMHLKQANERCQTLLEKWAEPFCALAWLTGASYEQSFLWEAWRQLLRNHPHDSICGCSSDQVHREMMPRFWQAQQIGETLLESATQHLAGMAQVEAPETAEGCVCARQVVVFNPSNWRRSEPAVVHLSGAVASDSVPLNVVVRDASGTVLPSQIVHQDVRECRWFANAAIPEDKLAWQAQVLLPAEVPPLGFAAYSVVTEAAAQACPETDIAAGSNWIENQYVRVAVQPNGTLQVTEKASGRVYDGCHLFEDTEDVGDEYDYSHAANSMTITSAGTAARISLVERGPLQATLQADLVLQLPKSASEDRRSRSEQAVACAVTTRVSICASSPRISVETTVDNQARDHRLRVWFPTGLNVAHCYAAGHFDVIRRSLDLPDAEGWCQQPQPTKAMQGFVDVNDGEHGLALCAVGLPEYEVLRTNGGAVIALTLLRSVGWLSRGDLITRPGNAGPKLPTPEAQCLGQHTFRYALVPHQGGWLRAQMWQHAAAEKAPLRAVATDLSGSGAHTRLSFLQVEPTELVVTCVKKAEREEALTVRCYNISEHPISGRVSAYRPIERAELLNLNEEPTEELSVSGGGDVELADVPGRRILTLALYFGES